MSSAYLSEIFVSCQGEGARLGQRHLFVRFAGCNLRCAYCDTPDSLVRSVSCQVDYPGGATEVLRNPVSAGDLASILERFCEADPSIGMMAITGGEPMAQHGFLAEWLTKAPPAVPCMLETNAIITAHLHEILSAVEVVSADIKLPSDTGESEHWQHHREFLRRCREAGVEVYVKMPVGDDTDLCEIRRGARLVAENAPGAMLYLQPITDVDGGAWLASPPSLLSSLAAASAELPRTRLRPQVHKLLGIR